MALDILEYAKLGQVFHASNQQNRTLSALSTTATGLILTNPYGSGKNLALLHVGGAYNTAPAGASEIGIAMSPAVSQTAVTHTSAEVVRKAVIDGGSGNSVALADYAATTVGTPVFVRFLAGVNAASSVVFTMIDSHIDGSIILPPGTSIQLAYVTTAVVGNFSFTWLEYKV